MTTDERIIDCMIEARLCTGHAEANAKKKLLISSVLLFLKEVHTLKNTLLITSKEEIESRIDEITRFFTEKLNQ